MKSPVQRAAFSLVEVMLALGLVTFCLIAIFSLLPVGLNSVKASSEDAGASAALSQIATEIRGISTNSAGQFELAGLVAGTFGYGSSNVFTNRVSLAGTPGVATPRYLVRVQLQAPTNPLSSGTALISLAWPAAGPVTWNATTTNWDKAQGKLSAQILFVPRL